MHPGSPGRLLQHREISMKDLPDDTENHFIAALDDGTDDSQKGGNSSGRTAGYPFSLPPLLMLFFFTLLEILVYFDRGGMAAGLEQIRDTFNISNTRGGILGGAYLFGFCTTSPYFAYVANFKPPLKMSAWGMFAWVVAVFFCGLTKNYYVLLICRIVTGIGESSFLSVVATMIDIIAPSSKRALWLSLFYSAIPIGYAMGEIAGGVIVDTSWPFFPHDESWRMVFVVEAVLGMFIVLIFCLITGPETILHLDTWKIAEDTDTMWTKLKILGNNPTYLLCVAALSAQTFTIGGISYYAIEYFQDVFSLTATKAGAIFGGVTVAVGFLGTALGGAILDTIKRKKEKQCVGDDLMPLALAAINTSLLFTLLALGPGLIFPFLNELYMVVILLTWSLLFVFMSQGPGNDCILWAVDLKDRPFAISLCLFSIHAFGDAAAPVVIGILVDNIGWSWAIFLGICPCALCCILRILAAICAKRAIDEGRKENNDLLLGQS